MLNNPPGNRAGDGVLDRGNAPPVSSAFGQQPRETPDGEQDLPDSDEPDTTPGQAREDDDYEPL